MADSRITFEVSVTGDGEVKLNKLTGAAKEFEKTATSGFDRASAAFASFTGNLAANAVGKAFDFITSSAGKLFDTFVIDGVRAAIETQSAMNSLTAALEQNGNATQANIDAIAKMADEYENTTRFSDSAVISAAAMIETISGLSGDALPKATAAAADLAVALGKDLGTASEIVARAAEGNVTALAKVGFKLRQGETEAAQFARALDFINEKWGGRAQKEAGTYAGNLARLGNQFENLTKVVGEAIITNPVLLAVFEEISKVLIRMKSVLEANQQAFQEWLSVSIKTFLQTAPYVVAAVDYIVRAFNALVGAFKFTVGALNQLNVPLLVLSKFSDRANDLRESLASLANDGSKQFADAITEQTSGAKTLIPIMEELAQKINGVGNVSVEAAARQVNSTSETREKVLEINQEFDFAELERQEALDQLKLDAADKYLEDVRAENEALKAVDAEANAAKIAANQATINDLKASKLVSNKAILADDKKTAEEQVKLDQKKAQAISGSINAVAGLQNAKSKELQAVGKAAAIASATMNTYQGASLALASIPFPFGFIAAAAVTAAGLVNVANIAGVGLERGGEIPAGFNNDTFPARLSSGENVVDRSTNAQLKDFLSGGNNSMAPLLGAILDQLKNQKTHVQVNLGSKIIFDEVRSGMEAGRVFAI